MANSYNTMDQSATVPAGEVNVKHPEDTTDIPEEAAMEPTYPEGGRRAWLTLLGCFCGFFAALSLTDRKSVV